jgi:SPP1 family predicted phage head-tail adaptor
MKPIKAGQLRDLVTIQKPVYSEDGGGGSPTNWETVGTAWARVRTIPASSFGNIEQFEMGQLRYVQHFNVQLRFDIEIENEWQLLYREKKLRVISVVNVDVMDWTTELYCREGG